MSVEKIHTEKEPLFVQHPNNPARVIAGEAVILTPSDSMIHILNSVGADIWMWCEEEISECDLVKKISNSYNVLTSQAEKDVCEFLDTMVKKGLLKKI